LLGAALVRDDGLALQQARAAQVCPDEHGVIKVGVVGAGTAKIGAAQHCLVEARAVERRPYEPLVREHEPLEISSTEVDAAEVILESESEAEALAALGPVAV
jgi:hypothetical protein